MPGPRRRRIRIIIRPESATRLAGLYDNEIVGFDFVKDAEPNDPIDPEEEIVESDEDDLDAEEYTCINDLASYFPPET